MSRFVALCQQYSSDKYSRHRYDVLYDRILSLYRNLGRPARLLEIGVGKGGSLRIWSEYLGPPPPVLFAVDSNPSTARNAVDLAGFYCGDQANREFLQHVTSHSGGHFDLVIDDGGHSMAQQQISLKELWPHVVVGGRYIIEDLESSIRTKGRNATELTTLQLLFNRIKENIHLHSSQATPPIITFFREAAVLERVAP